MSACNTLLQRRRKAVHLMVDGVGYDANGVVRSISQKCFALPTLHAAVASMGAAPAGLMMTVEIGRLFSSFDDLIDRIEQAMPGLFEKHLADLSICGRSDSRLFFAGWSERSRGPAAYMMMCTEPDADEYWQNNRIGMDDCYASGFLGHDPFKLVQLDGITVNPPPEGNLREAGLSFSAQEDDIPDLMDPEVDMLALLELQRRRRMAHSSSGSAHWVGGLALLTSITESGITQRVVHRWNEDRVGSLITPAPIDWKAWRAARTKTTAAVPTPMEPPPGMNRAQRRAWEAQQRKRAS